MTKRTRVLLPEHPLPGLQHPAPITHHPPPTTQMEVS
jgi:hypothetical protein